MVENSNGSTIRNKIIRQLFHPARSACVRTEQSLLLTRRTHCSDGSTNVAVVVDHLVAVRIEVEREARVVRCKWQIKNRQFFVINFHQFYLSLTRYSGCHDVTALQSWGETIPLVCRAVVLRQPNK
jgi:hypothetical protein